MSRTQVRGNVQIQSTTISNDQIVESTIGLSKLAEGAELIKRDGSVAFTGHLDLSSHKISNLAAPVSAMDAATKQYVDNATSGTVVTREVPSGSVNGSNMSFSLANTPNVGTEQVFVNGNLQQVGVGKDYTISGDTITFAYAPTSGDIILVNYIVDGVVLNADVQGSLNTLDSRVSALETTPAASAINDLTDVTITNASNGQVLQYNGTAWVNGAAPSSFSGSYNDLTDKPTLDSFTTLTAPSNGQVLQYNGTAWVNATPAASGITSMNALTGATQTFAIGTSGSDFAISSSGTTHTFNLPSASATNRGALTSANWTTFNNKLGSLNALTGATQTFAVGTSGTNFAISSSGTTHTFNLPDASTANRGVLTTAAQTLAGGKTFQSSAVGTVALTAQAAASPTANIFEAKNSAGTVLASVTKDGSVHARFTEPVSNNFATVLNPVSGTLTVDTASTNAVTGTLSASVTTWAFTNVPTENGKITTITLFLTGNQAYTYGDACSVNGLAVTGGVMWSGGVAPTSTSGVDIICFIIVRDAAAGVYVFGSAQTNFI